MKTPASLLFLLLIAITGIGAGITLVVIALRNDPGLVRSDYYQDGLRLDAHRALESAFDSLGLSLAMREEGGALVVEASGAGADDIELAERIGLHALTLELRRPDDPAADRDMPVTYATARPPTWVADVAPLRRGLWNVRAVFRDASGAELYRRDLTYRAPGAAL